MKTFYTSLIFLFSISFCSAQLTVETSDDVLDYINSGALTHPAMDITSIIFNGDTNAIGIFNNYASDFPLEYGIGLSTGGIITAVGGFGLFINNSYDNDPDLTPIALNGASMNDCVSIEVEFTALSDTLDLSFIFGSTEYAGFTCSAFSDQMGIFLKKNLEGEVYENFAFVPETEIPISINSLNSGILTVNQSSEDCEEANPNWQETNVYYLESTNGEYGITCPGLTVPISAVKELEIGESYMLKLAICDAFDGVLDSYLFVDLEGSSNFDCPLSDSNVGDLCYVQGNMTYFVDNACNCVPTYSGVDLTPTIAVSNEEFFPGDTVVINSSVINLGLQTSGDFVLNYYYSEGAPLGMLGEQIHTVTLSGLAFGDTIDHTFDFFDIPLPLNDFSDQIRVALISIEDPFNGNNEDFTPIYFGENTAPFVDLSAAYDSISADPSEVTIDFEFSVYNLGYLDFPTSNVNIYWSTDQAFDENDLLLYEYMGGALSPGDTAFVNLTLDIPQPINQATYYLILVPQEVVRASSLGGAKVVPVSFLSLSASEQQLEGWNAWINAENGIGLRAGSNSGSITSLRFFDILGKPVYEKQIFLSENEVANYALPSLPSGVYLLNIENGGQSRSFKMVKLK